MTDATLTLRDLRYQKLLRSPEALLAHLKAFSLEIRLSVGMWTFSPGGGRFHEKYGKDIPIPERIKMLYDMVDDGVRAVEAHYGWEVDEDTWPLYQQLERDTGIKLVFVGPNSFYPREFEFGTLSNPVPERRELAKQGLLRVLRFAKSAGLQAVGLWPGIDGYTYSMGTPIYQLWENFEATLAEALDEVPGMRINLEPKPYEPIPNNLYRTTADGLLMCRDVEARLRHPLNRRLLDEGHALMAMQPEVGHVLMGYEDPAYAYLRVAREGRLSHVHINSQPLGNYDQDLNVGVIGWEQSEALLYALKMIGYEGYFCPDIFPERMPIQKAIKINYRVLQIMAERIDALPHERVLECFYQPEAHRGDLELILAESHRAAR